MAGHIWVALSTTVGLCCTGPCPYGLHNDLAGVDARRSAVLLVHVSAVEKWMGALPSKWPKRTGLPNTELGREGTGKEGNKQTKSKQTKSTTKLHVTKTKRCAAPGLPAWSPTAVLPGLDPA